MLFDTISDFFEEGIQTLIEEDRFLLEHDVNERSFSPAPNKYDTPTPTIDHS